MNERDNDYQLVPMGKQKHIALIAHDNRKQDLISWVAQNREVLSRHFLCGTGTTAKLISSQVGLPVTGYHSGPLGGDQQIGARISEGKIDFMIFFWDPLTAQPHDPDVKALLRIGALYDIPVAMNPVSYTHLDVYKRQSSFWAGRWNGLRERAWMSFLSSW